MIIYYIISKPLDTIFHGSLAKQLDFFYPQFFKLKNIAYVSRVAFASNSKGVFKLQLHNINNYHNKKNTLGRFNQNHCV